MSQKVATDRRPRPSEIWLVDGRVLTYKRTLRDDANGKFFIFTEVAAPGYSTIISEVVFFGAGRELLKTCNSK